MKLQAPLCMAVAWVFLGTMQFSQSETLLRSLGLENAFVAEDEDNVMERGGHVVKPLPEIPDDWEYDWSHLLDWTKFHDPLHRNPLARKDRSGFDLPEGRQGGRPFPGNECQRGTFKRAGDRCGNVCFCYRGYWDCTQDDCGSSFWG